MKCYAKQFVPHNHFQLMNLRIVAIIVLTYGSFTLPSAHAQTPQAAGTSLPVQKLGTDDLIQIQVFNFPEFSRLARISANGTIQLPLVKQPIQVAGKVP